jgi:Rrf2 family transcriptional regulator, nitric oxide-sensitive transcriptional repressor
MHLSTFTDYSLRVLIYAAARAPDQVSLTELAEAYGISRNHLIQVVRKLGHLGYLENTRGRGGGIRLGKDPAKVRISDIVKLTEPGFEMAECFKKGIANRCRLTPVCALRGVLAEATQAFLDTLGQHTLGDIVANRPQVLAALGGEAIP